MSSFYNEYLKTTTPDCYKLYKYIYDELNVRIFHNMDKLFPKEDTKGRMNYLKYRLLDVDDFKNYKEMDIKVNNEFRDLIEKGKFEIVEYRFKKYDTFLIIYLVLNNINENDKYGLCFARIDLI